MTTNTHDHDSEPEDAWGEAGDPKNDPCANCGNVPTHATDGDGARQCASCAADDQAHGVPGISWDEDAPQEAKRTPVTYTPEAVEATFLRAFAAAEVFVGEDEALDIMFDHGILNQMGAALALTRDEAVAAFNNFAEDAKAEYNPDGGENSDTIRSDSTGDLVVNLAVGFLDDPEAETFAVIAAAWKDLDLYDDGPAEAGPERDAAIVAMVRSWF
jgi:hypothetical protein